MTEAGLAAQRRRLVVVTDSCSLAGAERSAAVVMTQLPESVEVVVMGPDFATVSWLAAQRRHGPTRTVLAPQLANRADWSGAKTVRQALAALAPATLHLNKTDVADLRYVELVAQCLPKLRIVSVVHHVEPVGTRPARLLTRALARRADATVAVSQRLARQLEGILALPPGGVVAIPNAVPPPPFRRRRRNGTAFTVGVLARFVAHKGVDDVLRAVAGLDGARLVLGGDGPERERLEALSRQLGVVDRTHFLGWVDPELVLARCDVLASAARVEGHPLTLLDARAIGLPIVAVDVGGVDEIVTGPDVGTLVPAGDVAALRDALAAIAERSASGPGPSEPETIVAPSDPAEPEHAIEIMIERYRRLYWPDAHATVLPSQPLAAQEGFRA